MREKQNSCLISSDLSENMPFLLQNSFLAILMLIGQKTVQKKEELVTMRFFRFSLVVTEGLMLANLW